MKEEWLVRVYDSHSRCVVGGIQVIDDEAVMVGDPRQLVAMYRKWRAQHEEGKAVAYVGDLQAHQFHVYATGDIAIGIDFQLNVQS